MEKTVLSVNTTLQGRYRIIQLLGHGGMGAVYEAMDENLRCRVTIKETFATDAEKEVRRAFAREAQLLANIRHPAIPKVSDYFEQGDGLFFVMEFIPGVNLEDALKLRGRPFPVYDVLGWADALLAALSELHSFNPPIVHKDIKPSNLKRSPKGEIFLLDFGLAKGVLGQMSTIRGQNYSNLQGHTPHFAPPEQIARTGTTPRSDLYSLAVTLWCLLTNTPPPDATLRLKDINDGLPDPLRPASELNPDVSSAVSDVLAQAMSLNMTNRPADAEEMREALREAVEAPLRAQAERERAEEEKNIRREAEAEGRRAAGEEFAWRLDEEQAAHAASVQRLKEEHESALSSLKEEMSRVRGEAVQAAREAEAQRTKARALDEQLTLERKARAEVEAALAAEEELRVRREEEVYRLENVLKKVEDEFGRARDEKGHELANEGEKIQQSRVRWRLVTDRVRRNPFRYALPVAGAALLFIISGLVFRPFKVSPAMNPPANQDIAPTPTLTPPLAANLGDDQFIPFRKGDKWGFSLVDKTPLIPPKYDRVGRFSEGLAAVANKEEPGAGAGKEAGGGNRVSGRASNDRFKWGYIDKDGKVVIPIELDSAEPFKAGVAKVRYRGMSQSRDKDNNVLTQPQSTPAAAPTTAPARPSNPYSDPVPEARYDKDYNPLGYHFTRDGKTVFGREFQDAGYFSEGRAFVKEQGKYGFIKATGEYAVKPDYEAARSFSQGLAAVKLENGNWGFIDRDGGKVIGFDYEAAYGFQNGLAKVKRRGQWGLINLKGEQILEFKYKDIKWTDAGLATVQDENGKWGVLDINSKGAKLVDFKYDSIDFNDKDFLPYLKSLLAYARRDNKYFYIGRDGTEYYEEP